MKKKLHFLSVLLIAMLFLPWQLNAQYLIEENFDNLNSSVPEGWVVSGTAITESYYFPKDNRWQSTASSSGSAKGWGETIGIYFNCYSAKKGETAILKSPIIDLTKSTKDLMLSFNLYDSDQDTIRVYISTDGGDTYLNNDNLLLDCAHEKDWQTVEIPIPAKYKTESNVRIVWHGISSCKDSRPVIDNVLLGSAPTCAKAKDLSVKDLTLNDVTLTWALEEGKGATAENYKITILNAEKEVVYTTTTAVTPVEGVYTYKCELAENKQFDYATYTYTIQGVCGEDDEAAVAENNFTIKCANPTNLKVDGIGLDEAKISWEVDATTGIVSSNFYLTVVDVKEKDTILLDQPVEGLSYEFVSGAEVGLWSGSLYKVSVKTSCSITAQSEVVSTTFITECDVFDLESLDLPKLKAGDMLCWTTDGSFMDDSVLILSAEKKLISPEIDYAANDLGLYIKCYSATRGASFEYGLADDVNLTNYESLGTVTISEASVITEFELSTKASTKIDLGKRFVIKSNSSIRIYALDFEKAPACPRIEAVVADEVKAREITLNWVGVADNYRVYFTELNNIQIKDSIDVTNKPAKIEGLKPETTYTIQVQSFCNGEGGNLSKEITVTTMPSCIPVSEIKLGEPTTTSVPLTWTAVEGQNKWLVSYIVKAGSEVVKEVTDTVANATTLIIAGLPSSTSYTITGTIKADCGEIDGLSAVKEFNLSFATACDVVSTFPYTEGFEGATFPPNCWTVENVAGSANTSFKWKSLKKSDYSAYVFEGTQAACYSYATATSKSILVTPQFNFAGNTDYRVELYAYRDAGSTSYVGEGIGIYVSETASVTENSTLLAFIPRRITDSNEKVGAVATAGMYQYRFDFNTSAVSGKYVIFEAISNYGGRQSIDNVWIGLKPDVEVIRDFNVDEVTANSARVTVVDESTIAFDIAYGTPGFDPATAENIITVNEGKVGTITGLAEGADYEIYVRARNGEKMSEWSAKSVKIHTLCNAFAVTDENSFIESFESYAVDAQIFGCWMPTTSGYYTIKNTFDAKKYYKDKDFNPKNETITVIPKSGERMLYKDGGNNAWLMMPLALEGGKNYSVSAYVRDCHNTSEAKYSELSVSFAVGTSTDINSAQVILNKHVVAEFAEEWEQVTGYFSVEEAGTYYVAINTYGNGALIDDIEVKTEAVVPPTVEVTALTSSSATFDLVSYGAESWELYYSTEKFTTANIVEENVLPVTSEPYTLTGLDGNTTYYYAFRSVKGATKTAWGSVGSFITECGVFALPFAESFEINKVEDLACWTITSEDPDGKAVWGPHTNYVKEGSKSMSFYYCSSHKLSKGTLVTPPLAFEKNATYRIEFYVYRNSSSSSDKGEGIAVYLNDKPYVTEDTTFFTFVPRLKGESSAGLGYNCIYPIGTVESDGFVKVEFEFSTADYAGDYIIFEAIQNYGGRQYMDNLTISKVEKVVTPTTPAAPVFSPAPGEDGKYTSQEAINVTLSCATEGASILYSLNYGSDDEVFTDYVEGTPIVFDAAGDHKLAAKSVLYGLESDVVVVTYIVVAEGGNEGTDIENAELLAMIYAKDGMVYVNTEVGNMIEVFTVQGQCIYASEATAQLTTINALNAEVVLVKVNNEIVKVAVK